MSTFYYKPVWLLYSLCKLLYNNNCGFAQLQNWRLSSFIIMICCFCVIRWGYLTLHTACNTKSQNDETLDLNIANVAWIDFWQQDWKEKRCIVGVWFVQLFEGSLIRRLRTVSSCSREVLSWEIGQNMSWPSLKPQSAALRSPLAGGFCSPEPHVWAKLS